jgi:acetate kinase
MKTADSRILTINGGSSSIKFALFETGEQLLIAKSVCHLLELNGLIKQGVSW